MGRAWDPVLPRADLAQDWAASWQVLCRSSADPVQISCGTREASLQLLCDLAGPVTVADPAAGDVDPVQILFLIRFRIQIRFSIRFRSRFPIRVSIPISGLPMFENLLLVEDFH